MKERNPKTLWDELRQAIDDWIEDDPDQGEDSALLFHLCLTAPLVLGLIIMLRHP